MQDALSGEMVRRQEAAARGRQLRLDPRLREGPYVGRPGRCAAAAPALAVPRRRRVLRDADGQARVHRPVRRHRPARSLPGAAPAAGLAAAGGGPAARAGVAPVVPDRPAHVQRAGVARGARRARRLRACRPCPVWATSSRTRPS
nr:hypothetical protein [Nocardioides convexus]